jgi:predicted nucleic-acid-binding Zn-ribbon protein
MYEQNGKIKKSNLRGRDTMRNTRICPKCRSSSISYANKISTGGGMGGKEYIGLGPQLMGGMESRFVAFICNNCGFTELYLIKG